MAAQDLDVYGIGNAIMDFQLKVEEQVIQQFSLDKGGMKLVSLGEQEKILAACTSRNVSGVSGGSAANTIIALAQLGASVGYGCLVGADPLGLAYVQEMSGLGIELHNEPMKDERTGTSVILITPDAERTMNTHLGASIFFDEIHVSESLIQRSRWVYIEGYLFASEAGQRAVKRALKYAKRHDVKVAITFSDVFVVDVFGEALREAVAEADLVFANLHEAQRFTGETGDAATFNRLKRAAPGAVMTLSERGALVHYNDEDSFIPPVPTVAVDDTGAGDMFAGGFLYGASIGLGADGAGKLACFLASRVVSQLGPRLHGDVRTLVKQQNIPIVN